MVGESILDEYASEESVEAIGGLVTLGSPMTPPPKASSIRRERLDACAGAVSKRRGVAKRGERRGDVRGGDVREGEG